MNKCVWLLSTIESKLPALTQQSYLLDHPTLTTLIQALHNQQSVPTKYSLHQGLLKKHSKILFGPNTQLKHTLLSWMHSSAEGDHSGRDATIKRVKSFFTWKGLH